MSNFTNPRVTRKCFPKIVLRPSNYREALPCLLRDFEDRCAYSMQHVYRLGGMKCLEVDHFNPHKKHEAIQEYTNLFPASRHCNGAKRDRWPTNKERGKGARFLNCCKESDYGTHIFEDPDTHEVVGVTSAGKYHVRNCDLNAPHLVEERKTRAEIWHRLDASPFHCKWHLSPEQEEQMLRLIEANRVVASKMIKQVPYLTGAALEHFQSLHGRSKWAFTFVFKHFVQIVWPQFCLNRSSRLLKNG